MRGLALKKKSRNASSVLARRGLQYGIVADGGGFTDEVVLI